MEFAWLSTVLPVAWPCNRFGNGNLFVSLLNGLWIRFDMSMQFLRGRVSASGAACLDSYHLPFPVDSPVGSIYEKNTRTHRAWAWAVHPEPAVRPQAPWPSRGLQGCFCLGALVLVITAYLGA